MDDQISHPVLQDMTLKSKSKDDGKLVYRFTSNEQTLNLESRALPREAAIKYMDDRFIIFESMFKEHPSAYPGLITQSVKCTSEYRPVGHRLETDEIIARGFDLFSNDRMVYGTCSATEVAYRSFYAMIYCLQQGQLYEIRFFTNKGSAAMGEDFLKRFTCTTNASSKQ